MTSKLIIITGGAGGIGRELSLLFETKGYKIGVLDFDTNKIQELKKAVESKQGNFCFKQVDITNQEQTQQAIEECKKELNASLHILINCAAINKVEKFGKDTLTNFKNIINVNIMGVVIPTAICLEEIKNNKGSIITFSSVAGFAPLFGRTAYCTSKYALHGFMDTLRTELRDDNVNLMMVCPSFVDTGFGKGENKKQDVNALQPKKVAEATWNGFFKKKTLLFIGKTARLSYWTYKFFPRLFTKKMLEQNRF